MRIKYLLLTSFVCLIMTMTQAQADTSKSQPDTQVTEEQESAETKAKRQEQAQLELENALYRAHQEKKLAALRAEVKRLNLEKEATRLKWEVEQEKKLKAHAQAMLDLKQQEEKLKAEVALSQAQVDQIIQKFNLSTTGLHNQVKLLKIEAEQLQAEISQLDAKKKRATYADGEATYLKEPLKKGGTLVISDRRVDLNGVITPWKANHVVDRIQYFNNKNATHPIFIVIESSPGGSVMAGWRIIKAMKDSQAPVHVVVKSWAASMAACITTLADQSYAYPNAEILHHQLSTSFWDSINVREQKEAYEKTQELWKRLGGPIAKKMGISLQAFDKKLYEKSAKGDWSEFADKAKQLRWVDHIITGIKDSGIREIPDPAEYTFGKYVKEYYPYFWDSGTDSVATTDPVVCLPPLNPNDLYYLYNPNGRYQVRSVK